MGASRRHFRHWRCIGGRCPLFINFVTKGRWWSASRLGRASILH